MDERYHSFLSERIIQYKEFFSITRNWNSQERTIMRAFDRHCQEMDDGSHVLTQEMVDSWCLQHPQRKPGILWTEDLSYKWLLEFHAQPQIFHRADDKATKAEVQKD